MRDVDSISAHACWCCYSYFFGCQLLGSYHSYTYRADGSRVSGTRFLSRVLEICKKASSSGTSSQSRDWWRVSREEKRSSPAALPSISARAPGVATTRPKGKSEDIMPSVLARR